MLWRVAARRRAFTSRSRPDHATVQPAARAFSTWTSSSAIPSASVTNPAITPAFALVYKPSDAISLYANYAEALVPGTTAPAVVNGVRVVNAGEVLEPYRAEQMEVGAKYDAGSFGGTLSVFRTTLPSAYFDADTGVYSDGGEQENQGVELTVFGEPITGLRLIGGATWLNTEINQALNPTLEGKATSVVDRAIRMSLLRTEPVSCCITVLPCAHGWRP